MTPSFAEFNFASSNWMSQNYIQDKKKKRQFAEEEEEARHNNKKKKRERDLSVFLVFRERY